MASVTMCKDNECDKSKDCYRFTAKAYQWQAWFTSSPRNKRNNKCKRYCKEEKECN